MWHTQRRERIDRLRFETVCERTDGSLGWVRPGNRLEEYRAIEYTAVLRKPAKRASQA